MVHAKGSNLAVRVDLAEYTVFCRNPDNAVFSGADRADGLPVERVFRILRISPEQFDVLPGIYELADAIIKRSDPEYSFVVLEKAAQLGTGEGVWIAAIVYILQAYPFALVVYEQAVVGGHPEFLGVSGDYVGKDGAVTVNVTVKKLLGNAGGKVQAGC